MTEDPPPKGWPGGALLVLAGGCLVAWFAFRAGVPAELPVLAPRLPLARPRGEFAAGAGHRLKVTYWNLEWFPGQKPAATAARRAAHVAAVLPVVERLDPDVLGLEEVADADAARLLTDHLPGFKVDVCSEFSRPDTGEPARQQVVLCSRLPVIQAWAQRWTGRADGLRPPRGFAFAAYQLPGGGILLVYGVHLKSNRADESGGEAANQPMREEAARELLAHEKAMSAAYGRLGKVALALIGGDMNTSLDDPRFESERTLRDLRERGGFLWGWAGIPLDLRLTLPAEGRYPATCFDHIFYRGDGARCLDCSIEPTTRAESDHRPVTAVFGW